MLRFALASMKQLMSAQGPAYLQLLHRVITHYPNLLWEVFALAAKGYHLRKITEQVTAVDNFKRYLTREVDNLQAEIARRAQDGNKSIRAYVRDVVAHVRKEYRAIHKDFRHHIEDARKTFMNALGTSLKERHLSMPMRW
jgi:NAD-specific glutamate dehydrogenase